MVFCSRKAIDSANNNQSTVSKTVDVPHKRVINMNTILDGNSAILSMRSECVYVLNEHDLVDRHENNISHLTARGV